MLRALSPPAQHCASTLFTKARLWIIYCKFIHMYTIDNVCNHVLQTPLFNLKLWNSAVP